MIDLKKYQRINFKPSVSELLPIFSLADESTIRLKDEGLCILYRVKGIDSETFGKDSFDYYADRLEDALKGLNENWTVSFFLIRKRNYYYPDVEFKSSVSRYIDEKYKERILRNKNYINNIFLSFTYRENKSKLKIFKKVFERDGKKISEKIKKLSEKKTKEEVIKELKERLRHLNSELNGITEALSKLGLERLKDEELLASYYFILNPAKDLRKGIRLPDYAFLDEYLTDFTVDADYEEAIKLDSYIYKVLSVKDYPQETEPGVLDGLLSLDKELKFSASFSFYSKEKAKKEMQKRRRHYFVTRKTLLHQVSETATGEETQLIDPTKMSYVYDAEESLQELDLVRGFGMSSVNFIAWGHTEKEADEAVVKITGVLKDKSYQVLNETLNKLSAYFSAVPGGEKLNPRRFMVSLGNFVDYVPFRTILIGDKQNSHLKAPALCAFETKHKTLFYFNFHVKDVGHTVIFGPTGAGKSVLLNFLASQYMKYDPQIYFFDYGYSAEILSLAQNGLHVDFKPEKRTYLNPVALITTKGGKSFLRDFLQVLIESFGYVMDDEDLKQLWKGIELVSNLPKNKHVLESFSSVLPQSLSEKLRPWTTGEYKYYFNNPVDMLSLSKYSVFEMKNLSGNNNSKVIAPLLMYLFERIDSSLSSLIPTVIFLDESWFELQHPIFARKMQEWLQTLRKLNTVVVFATQDLMHVAENQRMLSSVLTNVSTKIFLPNFKANTTDMKNLYTNTFGLTENEFNMVLTGNERRDYLIKQGSVTRLAQLNLDENITSLIQSDEYARRLAKAVKLKEGDDWFINYVEHFKKRTPLKEVEDLSEYFVS